MVRGYTTIEQAKKLLSLGLDPGTADMCYGSLSYDSPGPYCEVVKVHKPDLEFNDLPCWSLTALLELIPMTKMCHYDLYYCQYIEEGKDFPIYSTAEYNNSIDAAFEMVCWLIEYGYIKVNN